MLCRQIYRHDTRHNEMWFRMGKIDIRFGKLEFVLVTGLRFGPVPRHTVQGYTEVWVLDRCIGGIVSTFGHIIDRLERGRFDETDDTIKVAYLLFCGHILLGIKWRKIVPRWLCFLVDDLHSFEAFPWGLLYTVRQLTG
ncbi:hypothetical protein ACOSQ4_006053 [Xanthoceras sorbifolium]